MNHHSSFKKRIHKKSEHNKRLKRSKLLINYEIKKKKKINKSENYRKENRTELIT